MNSNFSNIQTPTLLLDTNRCKENIRFMADKAKRLGVRFRPHFKTHQSTRIAEFFSEVDVNEITVSSVKMARYFMRCGWGNITIAFPVNPREMDEILEMSSLIKLNLLVDHIDTAKYLSEHLNDRTSIYIKVDCGYSRSGIKAENKEEIQDILDVLKNNHNIKFKGFLSHFGNTYQADSIGQINTIFQDGKEKLFQLRDHFKLMYPQLEISIGDTPSSMLMEDFEGIDEIRPGNFLFFDTMQLEIGACSENQIALGLLCPVVSVYPERKELLIYGGGVHFGKETAHWNEKEHYGLVATYSEKGIGELIPDAYVRSLSQEHGIVQMSSAELRKYKPGDLILVLPVHSCMTADLHQNYIDFQENNYEHL